MAVTRSPVRSTVRSPVYSPTEGAYGSVDYLATWIGSSTYADFNAKKLDRQFQDSTGQTAVAASGDKVGLWLDGAQWGGKTLTALLAGQTEIVPNGGFSSATGWSFAGSWSWASGKAVGAATTSNLLSTISALALNAFYKASFDILDYVSGTVRARLVGDSAVDGPSVSGNGSYSSVVTTGAVANIDEVGFDGVTAFSGSVTNLSYKLIPGYHGLNASASQRLNLLISGTRYTLTGDGIDDNLLTTWLFASGGNTIFFDVDVPATLAGTQIIFGMADAGVLNRLSVGVDTLGRLVAGVGSQSSGVIFGTTDWRGARLVGALTHDGSTVKLFTLSGGQEYSAAQSGTPSTTSAARLAAVNVAGAGSWWAGGIARVIPIQKGGLTLADWQTIGPQLATAGA